MQSKKTPTPKEHIDTYFVRIGKQILFQPREGKIKSLHLHHPLENMTNRFFKRAFDIIFSLSVILFVLSWVILVLAVLVIIDSGWPVFFVQDRHGLNSQSFRCIKFRTMVKNNESNTRQSSATDERITRLGKIMRKYNLDELPQFFNVLLGDMSVVGPRPHMKNHTLEYEQLIPYYRERLLVKPGITGLAQACGNHGPTPTLLDMKHRVDYDLFYVRNWSFGLDIKLTIGTFLNIFHSSFHK